MLKSGSKKGSMIAKIMNEPQFLPRKVPDYMRKKGGSSYWIGSMVLTAFMYEVITGLIILFYYDPASAYASTENIVNNVPFGSLILTTHLYGAYVMIVLTYIHLLRNFFVGAYKNPRKNQWITGILLLLLTLAVGFFGYSMSGDVLAIDATDVGRGIAAGAPVIGIYLRALFFGSGTDLSLFHWMLGWHIVLAASIGILFSFHFFMAEYNTVMPARKDSDYKAPAIDMGSPEYKPWFPNNLLYMVELSLLIISAIMLIPSLLAILPGVPALFSPFPQVAATNPLAASVPPYPPWFLLFVYKELDFEMVQGIGPFWGTVAFVGPPLMYLLALPYLDVSNSLKLRERPITVSMGIVGIVYLIGLTIWGGLTPGVPIPTWQVLAFFLVPGILIVSLVSLISNLMEKGAIKSANPENLYIALTILGLSSFGVGILAIALMSNYLLVYEIPLVLLLMVVAICVVFIYAFIKTGGAMFPKKEREIYLKGSTYTVTASGFTLSAIVIFIEISIIPPTSVLASSLYGIGLGILFLIAAALLKIYRSASYGE